jgi:hypothetical protein
MVADARMRFSARHPNQPAGMIFGIIASGLEQQPLLWHIHGLAVTRPRGLTTPCLGSGEVVASPGSRRKDLISVACCHPIRTSPC